MSLDGIFLNSIKYDLYNKLTGGRVDKIYQPDKNEIVITIRNNGENHKLLMTAASGSPRLHITDVTRKNPQEPPMFCMLLRKPQRLHMKRQAERFYIWQMLQTDPLR